jgi:ABC-type Fe3+ transport system permease subunit
MKSRIAIFAALVVFALFSLAVMALWSRKLAGSDDAAQMDHAEYFIHTWTITFIVASVAAVFVLINMIMYKRRQHDSNIE